MAEDGGPTRSCQTRPHTETANIGATLPAQIAPDSAFIGMRRAIRSFRVAIDVELTPRRDPFPACR
ncbi:Hypothetical protein A7982_03297 [Minicystis rosea]|nr:Hypothetical protein A7982_03297 [Minicystis rosea]